MLEIKFDENNIHKDIIEKVIGDEAIDKINSLKINGVRCIRTSSILSYGRYNIDFDFEAPLTKVQISKCRKIFNERLQEKKARVEQLIKRCDHIFFDLKSYIKIKKSFNDFTYCAVESECEALVKKYLRSKASSYGVYRMRSSAFNKINCI